MNPPREPTTSLASERATITRCMGMGEAHHLLKALLADFPLEDAADMRVCLKMGDALATGLPMAT